MRLRPQHANPYPTGAKHAARTSHLTLHLSPHSPPRARTYTAGTSWPRPAPRAVSTPDHVPHLPSHAQHRGHGRGGSSHPPFASYRVRPSTTSRSRSRSRSQHPDVGPQTESVWPRRGCGCVAVRLCRGGVAVVPRWCRGGVAVVSRPRSRRGLGDVQDAAALDVRGGVEFEIVAVEQPANAALAQGARVEQHEVAQQPHMDEIAEHDEQVALSLAEQNEPHHEPQQPSEGEEREGV
mmetsp:Transcript_38749/g.82521  ORF Transcript_38749/g.82521 Transcript_38749/m.82521 type:complete len:237 (-) Transcript_38749:624-1334(-)